METPEISIPRVILKSSKMRKIWKCKNVENMENIIKKYGTNPKN